MRIPFSPFLKLIAIISLLGSASNACADILFLNLNGSIDEAHAAEKAAEARGEKLIQIPKISEADGAELRRFNLELVALENEHDDNIANAKIAAIMTEHSAVLKKYQMGQADIENAIASVEKDNHTISSFVISGHSSGSRFWGAFDESTSIMQLKDILDRHPKERDSIQAFLLWGCYSLVEGKARWWKSSYPSTQVVFGYHEPAPLGESAASPSLLKESLIRQNEVSKQTDLNQLNTLINSFAYAKDVPIAAVVGNCYVGSKMTPIDLAANKDCLAVLQKLNPELQIYSKYSDAEVGYENPPLDPHKSDLRTFYSDLQEGNSCVEGNEIYPTPDQVLGLIFFDNVRKNFEAYYKKTILDINQKLKASGIPKNIQIPDFSDPKLSRKQIIGWIDNIENYAELHPSLLKQKEMTDFMNQMNVKLLNQGCIPATWITELPIPGTLPAKPEC